MAKKGLVFTGEDIERLEWVEWGAVYQSHAINPRITTERRALCGTRMPPKTQAERLANRRCAQCLLTVDKARTAGSTHPGITVAGVYSLGLSGRDETGFALVRNGIVIARIRAGTGFDPASPHTIELARRGWRLKDEEGLVRASGDYLVGKNPFTLE